MRFDGNALLSAVRYELEKLRCSACGQIFTASVPAAAGTEKYTARARAVLALARYYLGLPWHRLEGFQALVGVPVPDATQWDQGEIVGDCTHPIFKCLEKLAAQGEVIFQDDTPGRVLSLIEENQQARAKARAQGKAKTDERTGMQTTALIVQVGGAAHLFVLYGAAACGGESGGALNQAGTGARQTAGDVGCLEPQPCRGRRAHPLSLSGAWAAPVYRVSGRFPAESAVVVEALKLVYEHDEQAHAQQLTAQERLAYHQRIVSPIFKTLKTWLEQQTAERLVEPNSSLGKAIAYMLEHWETLTRVVTVPGAPLDNNIAERALKLAIRQRKNSFFYASEHSAYIASILTSVIATCVQAGVNALDYLVAVQEHRQEVFANPSAWLPWNYQAALVPS